MAALVGRGENEFFFFEKEPRVDQKGHFVKLFGKTLCVCACVCVCVAIGGKNRETILSSLQACFVIAHSSGDFIVKNIRTIVYILNKNNTSIVA